MKRLPFCIFLDILVICSGCSQIQLLGTLVNFTLLWQKTFLILNCQTHCRPQKEVYNMVMTDFCILLTHLHECLILVCHRLHSYSVTMASSQPLSSNNTGGPTTPTMPPLIFKQKSKSFVVYLAISTFVIQHVLVLLSFCRLYTKVSPVVPGSI